MRDYQIIRWFIKKERCFYEYRQENTLDGAIREKDQKSREIRYAEEVVLLLRVRNRAVLTECAETA